MGAQQSNPMEVNDKMLFKQALPAYPKGKLVRLHKPEDVQGAKVKWSSVLDERVGEPAIVIGGKYIDRDLSVVAITMPKDIGSATALTTAVPKSWLEDCSEDSLSTDVVSLLRRLQKQMVEEHVEKMYDDLDDIDESKIAEVGAFVKDVTASCPSALRDAVGIVMYGVDDDETRVFYPAPHFVILEIKDTDLKPVSDAKPTAAERDLASLFQTKFMQACLRIKAIADVELGTVKFSQMANGRERVKHEKMAVGPYEKSARKSKAKK